MYAHACTLILSVQLGPVNTTDISCSEIRNGRKNHTRNLTISWATTEIFPDKTSRYVINVLPLEEAGEERVYKIGQERSSFSNKQVTVEVKLGAEYQIKVSANNCEDRLEGKSATTTVLLNGKKIIMFLLLQYAQSTFVLQFHILHVLEIV